jgi:nuclear transport factor 2 (NTF2) superfamily protein
MYTDNRRKGGFMEEMKTTYRVTILSGTDVFTDFESAKKQYDENYKRLKECNLLSNVYPSLWAVTEWSDGSTASFRHY